MLHLTLERRVTLWSALLVSVSLLVCGTGAGLFLHRRALAQLDSQLRAVAEQFFEQKRIHGGPLFDLGSNIHEVLEWLPAPGSENLVEVSRGATIHYSSPKLNGEALPATRRGFRSVEMRAGKMRAGVFTEGDITLRVAAPLHRVNALVRDLVAIILVGLPVMLGVVFIGGRIIVRRALDPVRRIADAAERITSHQLDQRLPVPAAVDEIQRLALVLNETLDRLEASFAQARRFSDDASHELRTPLTIVHCALEAALASPTLRDQDRADVADALDGAKRLIAITNGLLLLARADAGRLKLEMSPVDLSEVLAECLDDASIAADEAGIRIECDRPASAPMQGDAPGLRQVIGHLLTNALNYNVAGGRVRVTLAARDHVWVLEIANTGPGIPHAHAPHVFDRFFRGEHRADRGARGLGLSLARELTRAHGGTLELVGSDAEWTVFRLTLAQAA